MQSIELSFETFQNRCLEYFPDESANAYCQPMREALENAWEFVKITAEWTQKAASTAGFCWVAGWTKSGEYGGPVLQLVWLGVTFAVAQNIKHLAFGNKQNIVIIPKQPNGTDKKGS